MKPRRIAVLECEDAEKWKDMTLELWRHTLERPGDEFVVFRCTQGDFPTPAAAAADFDALIVGGSHYSAYEDHDWIRQLKALVPQYVDSRAKIIGCCFGCQVMAEALGGRVGPNPSGRFVLGVERVAPTRQLARLPQFERIVMRALDQQQQADRQQPQEQERQERQQEEVEAGSTGGVGLTSVGDGGGGSELAANASACSACFRVMESHGDQILELPPGAVALASSGSAAYEMWALGDRLIAFQFHIEFGGQMALEKIWPTLTASGRLSPEESAASEAQLRSGDERPGTVAELLQHFIAHGLGGGGGGGDDARGAAAAPAAGAGAEDGAVDAGTGQHETRGDGAAAQQQQQQQEQEQQQQQQEQEQEHEHDQGTVIAQELQDLSLAGHPSTGNVAASEISGSPSASPNKGQLQPPAAPLVPPGARDPPQGSGAASPTAASARSVGVAATAAGLAAPASKAASAASAVPFSFMARQRRQQQHEEQLASLSSDAVSEVAAALDARMRAANCDMDLLAGCDESAADEYGRAADIASALSRFASDLSARQADAAAALALAPEVLGRVAGLEADVAELEAAAKSLERRVAAITQAAAPAAGAAPAAAPAAPSGLAASVGAGAAAVSSGISGLVGGLGGGGAAAYKLVLGSFGGGGSGSGGSSGGAVGGGGASGAARG